VESQKPLPVFYKDVMLDCGYRLYRNEFEIWEFGKAGAADLKQRSGFKDADVRRSQKPNFEFISV